MVNSAEFTRRWKQIRGQVQQWWGKLSEADLVRINGQWELFVGALREKYGYTRETVEFEYSQRLAQLEARERQLRTGSQAPVLDIVEEQWQLMHSQARVWWDKLTDAQLVEAAGKADAVFGLLQAEYGYSSDRAEAEFKRRVKEFAISQQEHPTPETLFI
jgi:uncharacterized protein YjbJ (UPF0337 family)